MPFIPELFSAPALARIEERRQTPLEGVPFFDGLLTGEIDTLVGSFAGEPEVHQPVRGRIKGASAFARFVADTTGWMAERGVTVEDVDSIVTPSRAVDELVLHVNGDAGPIELPMALAADLDPDARMTELRIYFNRWPLSGARGVRPPLLQPDPDLRPPDVVTEYHRARAARDGDTAVAIELCTMTDDGRACALEYNAVPRSQAGSPPSAGIAVHVRGDNGKLAAVRIYDDVHPPLGRQLQDRPRTESRVAPCT
jgi:hypothetical protein